MAPVAARPHSKTISSVTTTSIPTRSPPKPEEIVTEPPFDPVQKHREEEERLRVDDEAFMEMARNLTRPRVPEPAPAPAPVPAQNQESANPTSAAHSACNATAASSKDPNAQANCANVLPPGTIQACIDPHTVSPAPAVNSGVTANHVQRKRRGIRNSLRTDNRKLRTTTAFPSTAPPRQTCKASTRPRKSPLASCARASLRARGNARPTPADRRRGRGLRR